ncbi:MAG: lipopolysaccharide kinase InaA family protein [Candidatus Hydrogenedentota bacterium]
MQQKSDIPPGFTALERGARRYIVAAAHTEAVANALDAALDGAGKHPGGRGAMVRHDYAEGVIIARCARRGGMIRFMMRDRFVRNRPREEFRIHQQAAAAGLPVAPPLGGCWTRVKPFYAGAMATQALSATELLEVLRAEPGRAMGLLNAVGSVTRRMHDAGIYHGDLQVRNILCRGADVYLIDFDKARHYKAVPPVRRAMNLYRLRRSLERHGFPPAYFTHVCAGYGVAPRVAWLDMLYRLRGWRRQGRMPGDSPHV